MSVQEDPRAYLTRVATEIEEEVRRRRASGDFPPSFERHLDLLFERLTPAGAREGHFKETLRQTDRHAYIDIDVPILSKKPGVKQVKRAMRSLMAWYLNYVVQEITRFTASLMRYLYMVEERLDKLEVTAEPLSSPLLSEEDLRDAGPDLEPWADLVVERIGPVPGRVLHAECGTGQIVARLGAAGVDAYGVDPRAGLLDAAVGAGLDARMENAFDHLRSVADLDLDGLVVSGFCDRLSRWDQRRLAALAWAKLASGSTLVVIGTTPNAWVRAVAPVQADLAPGRPLNPETWSHLLCQVGFDTEVVLGPPIPGLELVRSDVPGASEINANFERLDRALFGAATYAVVATRPR